MKRHLTLEIITEQDYDFLFDLLKSRDSVVNISHKSMPTFQDHIKFVKSNPYSAWYVILLNEIKIGTVYLSKQNEIGIFLLKKYQGQGLGKLILNKLMEIHPRDRYLANVSPKNISSIDFFIKNNFKLIQHTYELESRIKDHET